MIVQSEDRDIGGLAPQPNQPNFQTRGSGSSLVLPSPMVLLVPPVLRWMPRPVIHDRRRRWGVVHHRWRTVIDRGSLWIVHNRWRGSVNVRTGRNRSTHHKSREGAGNIRTCIIVSLGLWGRRQSSDRQHCYRDLTFSAYVGLVIVQVGGDDEDVCRKAFTHW